MKGRGGWKNVFAWWKRGDKETGKIWLGSKEDCRDTYGSHWRSIGKRFRSCHGRKRPNAIWLKQKPNSSHLSQYQLDRRKEWVIDYDPALEDLEHKCHNRDALWVVCSTVPSWHLNDGRMASVCRGRNIPRPRQSSTVPGRHRAVLTYYLDAIESNPEGAW